MGVLIFGIILCVCGVFTFFGIISATDEVEAGFFSLMTVFCIGVGILLILTGFDTRCDVCKKFDAYKANGSYCVYCGHESERDKKTVCKKCNREFSKGTSYCSVCGEKVEVE